MTKQEIEQARIEYAMDDLWILKHSGKLAITDTAHGVIFLEYSQGKFKAFNALGEALIGPHLNHTGFTNWLKKQYNLGE